MKSLTEASARLTVPAYLTELLTKYAYSSVDTRTKIHFAGFVKGLLLFATCVIHKTITLSELLPNINKFHNKILDFFRKFHEGGF